MINHVQIHGHTNSAAHQLLVDRNVNIVDRASMGKRQVEKGYD